ncbi:cytochrome b [Ancylobacter sp. 6x-1]|uniref:Cytochrome b n=1 Tax=Ancylobacter crimeensis TaxID=2579147 RepID=A0ABT0DDS0_9HYPH|nr:cytochrome b [Ancylobacter crimeensis]MCK0198096.1 cytochrome b [Ancylobacter crimeensis]
MPDRYGTVARLIHWAVVVLILVQFASAWSWGNFERGSTGRFLLFTTHLYSGYAILALAVLRIVWRLTHAAPHMPPMAKPMRIAAHATHGLLYLAILIQPIIGIVIITAFGKSLRPWPNLAHEVIGYALLVLAAVHVGAALWHQFVLRDRLIERMLPARR